jgi:hypothetical protein
MGLTDYTVSDKKYWQAGRKYEVERIRKLLDTSRDCDCSDTCRTDVNIYAFVKEELGIDLFKLIDGDADD